ncbi:hypothetical protein KF707_10660 [Candidatus Obscuribacterales bacterium]|jgi:hypothetical protein|nr:hypothetical protein [Candidatus Obscuribacterales bacterium]
MVRTFEAIENVSKPVQESSVSHLLLADTLDQVPRSIAGPQSSGQHSAQFLQFTPGGDDGKSSASESQLAIGPIPLWLLGDRIPGKNPDTPADARKKESNSLSSTIKSMGTTGLSEREKESVHAAFHKQLEQTKGRPVEERAAHLRAFVDELNTNLRADSKYSFTESNTGIKDKLSFSLVDKGEGSIQADLPKRTVYDTMEYSLSREPQAADYIPDPSKLPAELKSAFDNVMKQSREEVASQKYTPALDAVSRDLGLNKLKTQAELNKALGLNADSPTKDYYARLESLMMSKLGLEGQDYKTNFSTDVNRRFLEILKLKPGTATTEDVLKALKDTSVSDKK